MDVEMADVTELLGGGATGTTPNVENTASAAVASSDSYSVEFTRTTLEAVHRDVQGDYENSEQSQDEILLTAVKTVLEKCGKELFGKYAAKRWYRMSKEEWMQVAEGNMDPDSSPFPFKFMMSADKGKGRRVWAEIKGSMKDENALLVIKSSASVKGIYEIKEDEIDNPKSKGMSSAPFRLYKAYLTLRAMAADSRVWKVENAALITQIMRNLFKGKPKMYENKSGREPIKGDFQALPPVVVDVPLVHQPSPWGRGNREMRTAHDITKFGKANLQKLPTLDPRKEDRGMDENFFPMEFFQEWMASRPTAIAILPSIIAMLVVGSKMSLSELLKSMDVMMAEGAGTVEEEKMSLLVRTAVEISALVADYAKHVDGSAMTVMKVVQDAIQKKVAPGTALFRRYVEIVQRMANVPTTIRELYDFEKMKKLTVLNGKHANKASYMLVPEPGKHKAQHYWIPIKSRSVPNDRFLADLTETATSSPDSDQAFMFHGSNLEDLWRQSCNAKISRALPQKTSGEMYARSEGIWCAMGQEALGYAPYAYLAKGWMARIVLIIDRTVTEGVPHIVKGSRGSTGKANQILLQGRRGVPFHGILASFAHETCLQDHELHHAYGIMRSGLPYTGANEGTFMRNCPVFEAFPFDAEALHWEAVAARTGIFTEDGGPRAIRYETAKTETPIPKGKHASVYAMATIARMNYNMQGSGIPWQFGSTDVSARYANRSSLWRAVWLRRSTERLPTAGQHHEDHSWWMESCAAWP